MLVNLENIKRNILIETQEQITTAKLATKTIIPSIIVCVIMEGLSELALKQSCESLSSIVSYSLGYGVYPLLFIGCLAFFKGLEYNDKILKEKKVEYLKILKKDFEAMQEEIIRLRQQ